MKASSIAIGWLVGNLLTYSPAFANETSMQYGIGHMNCAMITKIFPKNDTQGRITVLAYISGFVSGANLTTTDGSDVTYGVKLTNIEAEVFSYCATHPKETGAESIARALSLIGLAAK